MAERSYCVWKDGFVCLDDKDFQEARKHKGTDNYVIIKAENQTQALIKAKQVEIEKNYDTAILFALSLSPEECREFLGHWMVGNFDIIKTLWPEFTGENK